jgi:hypothetical protein
MQLQYNKSNKLVQESKDVIITNSHISKSRILKVDSSEVDGDLLPTNTHPYDHFIVLAWVEIQGLIFSPSKLMAELKGVRQSPVSNPRKP